MVEGKGEDFYFYPDLAENMYFIAGYKCRGGSRRIWRSATRCLWTRADYCKQAFTHSSVKPTIIVFKPSEARWAQKTGHWARSCNGFAAELQMGKILRRLQIGRWPVETFFGRPDEDFGRQGFPGSQGLESSGKARCSQKLPRLWKLGHKEESKE